MPSLYDIFRSAISRATAQSARQEADQAAILRRASEVLRQQRGMLAGGRLPRQPVHASIGIQLLRAPTETAGQLPPTAPEPPTGVSSPRPRSPAGIPSQIPLLSRPAGPREIEAPGGLGRLIGDFGRAVSAWTKSLVESTRLWRQAAPPGMAPLARTAAMPQAQAAQPQRGMRPGAAPALIPQLQTPQGVGPAVPTSPATGAPGGFFRGLADRLLGPFGRLNRELSAQLQQVAVQSQRSALASLREPPSQLQIKRVAQSMEEFRRVLDVLSQTARTAGERMFYRRRAEGLGQTAMALRAASTMIPEAQAPAFMARVAPIVQQQLRGATFAEAGAMTRGLFLFRGLLMGPLAKLTMVGGALIAALEGLTGSMFRHAEGLKTYSGLIAGGIARLELTKIRSDIRVAAGTQEYARELLSAQRRLSEALVPLRTQTAKMGYQLATWWAEAKAWLVQHLPRFLRGAPQAPVPPEITEILTALASGQFGGRKNWPPPRP